MTRGLFEWRYFFYLFPVHASVIVFSVAPQPFPIVDAWRWAIVILLSYAITGIAYAIARHFRASFKSTTHEIIAAVTVGVVRGFAILDISLLLGLPAVKPYFLRPLNSGISFPLWLLVIHLFLGARREFQLEFHKMYVRTISSQIAKAKQEAKSTADELSERIATALSPLRKQFEKSLGARVTSQHLAEEALIVRAFVDAEIRPLSHEMWRTKSFKPPRLAFSRLLIHSLIRKELPLLLIVLPIFVFSLVSLTTSFDFRIALEMSLASNLVIIPTTLLYRWLFQKEFLPIPVINIGAILINLLGPVFIDEITGLSERAVASQGDLETVGAIWYLVMLLSFTAYQSVTRYYDSISEIMKKQLLAFDTKDISALDTAMQREFASYLHGEVQSELLSASMQMNQAAEDGDIKLGKKAMKRANEILKRDHQSYVVGQAISIERRLEKIVEAWQGIADISLEIPSLDNISDETSSLLTDLVEELAANSVRHGSATKGKATIEISGHDLILTFEDNGAEIKSRKRGLGSDLLKKRTLSYSYERLVDGNQIKISLPR